MSKDAPKRNLDALVREDLREKILSSVLADGTHLSEIKISKEYDVSRTPVREALCALAADGLVEMIPNRGCFVKTPSGQNLIDLMTMYSNLVAMGARMATSEITETSISAFESELNGLREASTIETFNEKRSALNSILLESVSNSAFSVVFKNIEQRIPYSALNTISIEAKTEIEQGYATLLIAVKREKPETAEKSMRELMLASFSGTWSSDSVSVSA